MSADDEKLEFICGVGYFLLGSALWMILKPARTKVKIIYT